MKAIRLTTKIKASNFQTQSKIRVRVRYHSARKVKKNKTTMKIVLKISKIKSRNQSDLSP
jgi:hypothetical protein